MQFLYILILFLASGGARNIFSSHEGALQKYLESTGVLVDNVRVILCHSMILS